MCDVTEYSTAYTGKYSSDVTKFSKLHLAWKYAWIYVLGHYLFLEIHSFPWVTVHFMLLEKCSLLETDNVPVSNGGWGITGITLNKILKAECITSECVGKFWSKHRLTISPFHYPANNSNSLFIPFISAANHGHFSVPMWSATIASITLFVISWLVSAFELLKVFTKKKNNKKEIH